MRCAPELVRQRCGPVEQALQAYAEEVAALRGEGLTRDLPATRSNDFSRWDFRWNKCGRT